MEKGLYLSSYKGSEQKEGTTRFPLFYAWIEKRSIVIEEKIRDLLEEKFQEEDYADCFIVEVKYNTANKKLQAFVDSDSSMTFRKCQRLSRFLESYIDEGNWLGEKYTLEVSSPGVDRPLQLVRQYKKNIGRRLEVLIESDDKKHKGTLIKADDQKIVLQFDMTRKQGKKKIKETVEQEIPYNQINKAVVKITF